MIRLLKQYLTKLLTLPRLSQIPPIPKGIIMPSMSSVVLQYLWKFVPSWSIWSLFFKQLGVLHRVLKFLNIVVYSLFALVGIYTANGGLILSTFIISVFIAFKEIGLENISFILSKLWESLGNYIPVLDTSPVSSVVAGQEPTPLGKESLVSKELREESNLRKYIIGILGALLIYYFTSFLDPHYLVLHILILL